MDPSQTVDQVMTSVLGKIERRANAFGVKEPIIQRQGENRILVQLPGEKNIDEAKKLIGQVALLEFKEVTMDATGQPQEGRSRRYHMDRSPGQSAPTAMKRT